MDMFAIMKNLVIFACNPFFSQICCHDIYCTFKLSSFRSLFCWFGHFIPWCWTCVWNPRTCRHPSSQDNSVSSALEGFLQSCCTPGMKPLTGCINDEMYLHQIGSQQWFNKASSVCLNFKQSYYFYAHPYIPGVINGEVLDSLRH